MEDARNAPFRWQSLAATRLLRKTYEGKARMAAVAIYDAMTEVANNHRAREYEASRKEVAAIAGCGLSTLDRYVKDFERIGLLRVERRRQGTVNLPNIWNLTEPAEGGSPATVPVAPERGAYSITTSSSGFTNDVKGVGGSGGEGVPDLTFAGYPDGVKAVLPAVMETMAEIARGKRVRPPSVEAVAKAMADFPDRDFVVVVRDLRFETLQGKLKARQLKGGAFATTWRNFLKAAKPQQGEGGAAHSKRMHDKYDKYDQAAIQRSRGG